MLSKQKLSSIITETVESLSSVTDIDQITKIVAAAAQSLTQADGATFVLREDDKCYYANEKAISPLWKGKRFNMETCISGWAMINRQVICIPDIYQDDRIPHDAYRPTFVKSLCMVPIRSASPIGAIGNYWAKEYQPTEEEIKSLQILANTAAVAVENWELKRAVERRNQEKTILTERHHDLEAALHSLVHDLRNPISSILAFSELLRKNLGPNLDSQPASYIDSISRTSMRINQTIGQMLALYKLTTKALNKKPTDLSIIGMEIESQLRAQDPARPMRIRIDDQMMASTDPLLIRLVLENLFGNAYKFTLTRESTEIHFGIHASDEKQQVFFVKDNGVGFEENLTHKLFKPLSRLHDANFSGTGLGLASVAQIINAHGGSVRAEGQVNQGAIFYFALPRETVGASLV